MKMCEWIWVWAFKNVKFVLMSPRAKIAEWTQLKFVWGEVVVGQASCSWRLKYREWKHPIQPSYSPTESTSFLSSYSFFQWWCPNTIHIHYAHSRSTCVHHTYCVVSTWASCFCTSISASTSLLLGLLTSMVFHAWILLPSHPCIMKLLSFLIPEWQLAMSEELACLNRTCTWDLVLLPITIACHAYDI